MKQNSLINPFPRRVQGTIYAVLGPGKDKWLFSVWGGNIGSIRADVIRYESKKMKIADG